MRMGREVGDINVSKSEDPEGMCIQEDFQVRIRVPVLGSGER